MNYRLNQQTWLFLLSGAFLLLSACMPGDKKAEAPKADQVFADYQLIAEDGDDKLLLKARFLTDEFGDVVALPEGVDLLLDGQRISGDSTPASGRYYEVFRDIAGFEGQHVLLLLKAGDTVRETRFDFRLFQPAELFPDTLQREDLVIRMEGLEAEDFVRIMAADTTFLNRGINRVDTVQDGAVHIYRNDLYSLASGPVQLMLIREWAQPVDAENPQKGRLTQTYSLKKEVILAD